MSSSNLSGPAVSIQHAFNDPQLSGENTKCKLCIEDLSFDPVLTTVLHTGMKIIK